MTAPKRPRRKRADDRLFARDLPPNTVACDTALAPFDRAAIEADRKWGMDRLVELAPPEMAAKYGKALGLLNEAIQKDDPAQVAALAQNCIKGIAAMEAAAVAAGKQPLPPKVLEVEYEGGKYAVVQDPRDTNFYAADPGTVVFTMREVVRVMTEVMKADARIEETKKHFPNAEIRDVRTSPKLPDEFWETGDPVPF